MCGLAGFLRVDGAVRDQAERQAILERMGRLLERRGPDDQQIHDDENLSFVFRRLSIVDVEGGRQPIWNEDRSLFVAVNGEIYNHRELRAELKQAHSFSTDSDSEIVLHLFEEQGVAAFDHLIGMYAIVLWDARNRRLWLARDRMGVKPLYYAECEGHLLFGSELKALLAHPDCPREFDWKDLVSYGPQQKPRVSTYLQGVNHLPGGHWLEAGVGRRPRLHRYWCIEDHFGRQADLSAEQAIDGYDELMADSVRRRLMSDVPLGIFLSGGIDSALITAMAARHQVELDCFTVVERTTWRAGDVEQARQVSADTRMRLHPALYEVDALRDAFDLAVFEQQIAMMESPRFDPEWLFKLRLHQFARARNPNLKVILLGQGADEFAGGYSARLGSPWTSWKDYLQGEVEPELHALALAEADPPDRVRPNLRAPFPDGLNGSTYQRKMRRLTWQLQHFNLWHEDRTSSHASVESRVPFLDHRVVEWLAGLSPELHESLFWDKAIVRAVLRRWLPEYPPDKKKVSFFVTDDFSSIDAFIRAVALQVYPQFRDKYGDTPFDPARLEQLFTAARGGGPAATDSAWQLIEAMAIVVFMAFCRDPEAFVQPRERDRLDGIRAVEDHEWAAIGNRFESSAVATGPTWTLQTRVAIPAGHEVLTPLTEGEDEHVLLLRRDDQVIQTVRLSDAAYWTVMMLEKMGRDETALSVSEWSQVLDRSPEEIVQVLDRMASTGFVERVGAD